MSKITDPIRDFNARIPQVTNRFAFDRPWRVVGKADIQDAAASDVDEDIYAGTVITPQGFARLAYHIPTSTLCLLVSKTAVNLRGERQKNGRILATYEGLAKSYLVCARRSEHDDLSLRLNAQAMRMPLHRFCMDMDERTKKHFTLFSGSTSLYEGVTHEIHTNGRLAYTLDQREESHKIRFYAPIRREAGSFVPVELGQRSFWDRVSNPKPSISKIISYGKSYEESRHDLALHWQKVSSRIWDEKSLYADEGFGFRIKRDFATLLNGVADQKKSITTSALVGVGVAVETHQVGWGVASFVAAHIVAHQLLEHGAERTQHISATLRQARQRKNIDAYPADAENVSDYFKIKNRANIAKLCPHIDLNQINPSDFVFLQGAMGYLIPDHDVPEDGMRPASLRGHLLSAHQRGFSSSCTLPDPSSRMDLFQSGLVRFMHEANDGQITIYAGYRPDACVSDIQRLPERYIERFEDGKLVRIDYDRRHAKFSESFKRQELVEYSVLERELRAGLLFNGVANIEESVKEKSILSVLHGFRAPAPESTRANLYMGGQPPVPPDIAAIL